MEIEKRGKEQSTNEVEGVKEKGDEVESQERESECKKRHRCRKGREEKGEEEERSNGKKAGRKGVSATITCAAAPKKQKDGGARGASTVACNYRQWPWELNYEVNS